MTRFEDISYLYSYLSSCWLAIFDSVLCFCSRIYGISPPPKVWGNSFEKILFMGTNFFGLICGRLKLMIRLCQEDCFINAFSSNLNIVNLIFFSYHGGIFT